jgi:hypothetical protein
LTLFFQDVKNMTINYLVKIRRGAEMRVSLGLVCYLSKLEEMHNKTLINNNFISKKFDKYALEIVLAVFRSGSLIFIFRDVVLYISNIDQAGPNPHLSIPFSSYAQMHSQVQVWIKNFYKKNKIKSGHLSMSVSFSKTKNFILTALDLPARDSELPFILAHLKQHLGERLSDTAVDFQRLSQDTVRVVTSPAIELQIAKAWDTKKIPLVSLEPSLESLRRMLLCEGLSTVGAQHNQHMGLFWIDATSSGKKYRLTFCQGLEVLWDKVFESLVLKSFDLHQGEMLTGPEVLECADFLESALSEYLQQISGSVGRISVETPAIYLCVQQQGSETLTGAVARAFAHSRFTSPSIRCIFPETLGLQYPDEFVSYGLTLRAYEWN